MSFQTEQFFHETDPRGAVLRREDLGRTPPCSPRDGEKAGDAKKTFGQAPTTPAKGARGSGACNTPAFGGPSSPPASPLSPVMPAEGESQIFRSPPTFSKENSSPASEKQPKAATKRAACRWPPTSNLHEATAARPLQPIQPQVRVRTGYPEEYRVGEKAAIGVAPWPHPAPPRPFFVVNPAIRGRI